MRYMVCGPLLAAFLIAAGPVEAVTPYVTERGGFGAYFLLMGVSRASQFTETSLGDGQGRYQLDPAGGFGIFGEYLVSPRVALGGEFVFAFPDVDDTQARSRPSGGSWSDWTAWTYCGTCDNGILFMMSFRARFPIQVHPWVRVYPLIALGLGTYTARYNTVFGIEQDNENWVGAGWSVGFGVEVSTPVLVTPFLEVRYIGGVGGNTDRPSNVDRDTLLLNSLTFVLAGLRVF